MGELHIQPKDIVVPGQILATGMDYLPTYDTFRDGDHIIAARVGLVNVDGRLIKLIPLNGRYFPKQGDQVIGRVVDMNFSNWYVDINFANDAVLSSRDTAEFIDRGADLSKIFCHGDYIVAEIAKVTRGTVELNMRGPGFRKLGPGKIIKVNSTKVPRIIGKQGSMITLIKEKTGCKITVGQNGLVWVSGEPAAEIKAIHAINLIEQKAHLEGLTDEVTKFLGAPA
ncbi:MAG TPA: exosome complex RNA-binding protein Rrp4 [Candidatus Nanoarchaeia archaeon]|nr:exosome complex RNA-binding protein Rrp4 [Candidatus Nanoarchaeia archaeon]